ncbi:MAG: sigma-70 family RNA polymerase sigma factor [Bacteroidetes bacterium]|nr:sigma-70 family RNA polymerase sigma factor [Bacteroidota bacterium]
MFLRRKASGPLSDEDLVLRIRGGHQASLAALWDRYAHLLFGVAMKYLKDIDRSKDAVLDLFTALPQQLKQHEVQRFRPWVHAVMRNQCLMLLRKHDPGVRTDIDPPEPVDEAGEALLREATLQQLEAAIATLNEGQRTCIRLFYLDRLSYQQVAERTGLDIEQVRSHLQNGRRNLRLTLERHGHRN